MASNNPYDNSSSHMDKVMGTAALGGASFVAYKAITDGEGFQKSMTKVANAIFPTTTRQTGLNIRKDQIATSREKMLAMEAHSNERNGILDTLKTRKSTSSINAGIWEKVGVSHTEIKGSSLEGLGSNLRFSKLSDIKDAGGNEIGHKFTEALNKLGLEVIGDPTFKGTTGTFRVMEGGRERSLEIPFAAQDKNSAAWITKQGDAEYITHLRSSPKALANGKIKYEVRDHNTAILDMLRSPGKIVDQARSDKDFIRDFEHLQSGKSLTAMQIKEMISSGSSAAILDNMATTRVLQRAVKSYGGDAQNWVVATSNEQKAFQSGYVQTEQHALRALDSVMHGAGSPIIGVNAAAQDADKPLRYAGGTYTKLYSYPQELAKDSSLMEFHINDKVYTKDTLHEIANETTRIQYGAAFNGGLGFTLGQDQTSRGVSAIRPGGLMKQVEREKSEKGLRFVKQDIGTRPMNGVKSDVLEKFRTTPTVSNIGGDGLQGYQKAYQAMYNSNPGEKRGVVNLFGMLNPMGDEEYMGIAKEVYGDMHAFQPVQWSVSKLLSETNDKGLMDRSMVEIEVWNKGVKEDTIERKLIDIFRDQKLREDLRKSSSMNIKISKNNILGLTETGGEVWNHESMKDVLGMGGQNVLSRGADIHINKENFERMLVDNADMLQDASGNWLERDVNAPIKFYGNIEGQMTKGAVLGQRARGVIYGHIEKEASALASKAGIRAGIEFLPHIETYKKILPTLSNGKVTMQKGSPEMLQFLQESMMGHLMAYNKENVTVTGALADRFAGYLGMEAPKTKALNLTKNLLSGNMQWKQDVLSEKGFAKQLEDTAAVLGSMKQHSITGGGNVVFDEATFDYEKGSTRLAEAWDRATGKDAKQVFEDLHAGKDVSKDTARAHVWNMISGVAPQEIMPMTQGTGFNTMNIGFRDLHYFLDKPGILEEFAYQNTSNSTKISAEMSLMAKSMSGDEGFNSALKAHEARIGQKIKTYTPAELDEMLGGFGGPNLTSEIKHPNVFKNTFLNSDVNAHGFKVNMGDREMYFGSADLFGKSYFLPKNGKVTFENFAMDTVSLLNKTHMRGEATAAELAAYKMGFSAEMASAKSGLLKAAAMSVDYAMYSKHTADKALLHSDYLKFSGEHGKDIENMLGNATKVSHVDFRKMIQQQLTDNLVIAGEKKRSLASQLELGFGKDNFFTKYATHIDSVKDADSAKAAAKAITQDQIGVAQRIHSEVMGAGLAGSPATKEQADRIRKLMMEDSLMSLSVRYPAIYGSSYTAGTLMVDQNMLEKQMAPGKIAIKNLFGDFDGDASMIKGVFSKLGRKNTQQLIDQTQRHTAKIIDTFKAGGGLQYFKALEEKRTAVLGKDLTEKVATQLIHNAPLDSALAAWYTKSLTGSLNIKAQGVKGYMDDLVSNKGLSDIQLSKVHAYFSTIPSLFTEQKAISSKQAERLLGGKAGMENVTDLIGSITSRKMLDSIKEMNGDVHPLITMALASGGHKTQFAEEEVNLIKNIADLNLNIRTLKDDELKQIHSFLNPGATDFEARLAKYKDFTKENMPFLDSAEGKMLKMTEGTGFIDIVKASMKSNKGFASETLGALVSQVMRVHNSGNKEALEDLLVNHVAGGGNHFFGQGLDMMTQAEFSEGKKTAFSGKSIRGWDEVKKLGRWLTEEGKAGGRMGGLAAAVLGGFTALNLLSGDGTPQTPNDLPSVNNPSFSPPRSNGMNSRRTMSADVNYNSNVSLLTDNNTPASMLSGAVQGLLGVSSVNVSDGTNPYLSDMHRYSNN